MFLKNTAKNKTQTGGAVIQTDSFVIMPKPMHKASKIMFLKLLFLYQRIAKSIDKSINETAIISLLTVPAKYIKVGEKQTSDVEIIRPCFLRFNSLKIL